MSGNSPIYRYGLVLVTAVAACLLLALSWPRLHASMRYLPVDTAISNYWKTREFDNAQLGGLIERAQQAITIHDHYRYFEGLSELQVINGQDMSQTIWQRRKALEASINASEQALVRSPAKPRTWLRIAMARESLGDTSEAIIPALKMSILTGRYEPALMIRRLELGLRYLAALDAEGIRLLRDQAELTWRTEQKAMLQLIKSGAINPGLLSEIFSDGNQAMVLEIEALLAK